MQREFEFVLMSVNTAVLQSFRRAQIFCEFYTSRTETKRTRYDSLLIYHMLFHPVTLFCTEYLKVFCEASSGSFEEMLMSAGAGGTLVISRCKQFERRPI